MRASATPTADLLTRLKAVVGPGAWLTDAPSAAAYTRDWLGLFDGRAAIVLRPATTSQVSDIVGLCAKAGVAVVPQGGNTGYAGGAAPDDSGNQVVVSLERMNRVRELDAENYSVTAEAGCVLQQIQNAARDAGLLFPLSLGAEGSCLIGGNLATNAGGTAVLRYGNVRDLALGLEVVLPDGRIWHGLRRLRKDNTGYDFRHLFIGAEGTLGIITAAVLKLYPRPQGSAAAMVALADLASAVSLLDHMRRHGGHPLTGFEYIQGSALELVAAHVPEHRVPLLGHDHVALIELAGAPADGDISAALDHALAAACETGLIEDAVIATSPAQREAFWGVRESIPEALRRAGECIRCDVSVPVSTVPAFISAAGAAVADSCPGVRVVAFGHVGDGNIHFDLLAPDGMDAQDFMARLTDLTDAVYDVVARFDGSFSAEHGIGKLKLEALCRYRDPVELDMLRAVKHALDPQGLMNPGKVVPEA